MAEPGACVVAGGTDLIPNMKRLQVEPETLVSLRRVAELRGIRGDSRSGLVVGACATLAEVSSSKVVGECYAALSEAAGSVGSPQVRNSATLGGNLCQDTRCNYYDMPEGWREGVGFCLKQGGHTCRVAPGSRRCWAVSSSDIAPAAIALGGRVRLVGAKGERVIDAKSLYRNDGALHLDKRDNEIIAEVSFPPPNRLRSKYFKLRQRGSIDFPLLGVAAAVRLGRSGVCETAKVVLGAVGSSPVEVAAADSMVGNKVSGEVIGEVASAASETARPLDNAALTLQYRKSMVEVCVARVLKALVRG